MRLLKSALPHPELALERAMELVEYYQERNRIARESHRKRWLARHEGVKYDLVHPTKAYLASWIAKILSLKNSWSRKPKA